MRRILVLALLLLVPAPAGSRAGLPFSGVFVRDQDAHTMELGMLRAGLDTLRSVHSRSRLHVLVAPSEAAWDRDVGEGLQAALSASPEALEAFVSGLPPDIGRAGPGIGGAVLALTLPNNRGSGVIAFHLPPLLNAGRGGNTLLNSPAPNQGHFVSGVDVPRANEFVEDWVEALYLPGWASALGRGGAPTVPLRPLPGDGRGAFVLYDGDAVAGEGGSELREALWEYVTADSVPLDPMDTFPRRLDSLREMLRTVRVESTVLATPEGAAATLAQAPEHWTFETRVVSHPERVISLVAPVTARMNDGELHSVVVAIVAAYTPLLLTFEEAPLYLGVPAQALAQAVHDGAIPHFRDGDELLLYRGHLDRWAAGDATAVGKVWSVEEAREQAAGWGKRFKLKGLTRASQGPLPLRMVPLDGDERGGLVDDRVAARAQVDREDLPAWLRHFEPSLKPGKRAPAWALSLDERAARLPAAFSMEGPWEPPRPARPPPVAAKRGGVGPVTLSDEVDDGPAASAAFAGEIGLEILDLYSSQAWCRTGGTAEAVVQFDVVGVPEGSVARLTLEWDLLIDGRTRGMKTWPMERGAGTHEVSFDVPCPDEPAAAQLAFVLLDPGHDLMIEQELAIDVRHPGGRSWPALAMPAEQSCLAAAGEGDADSDGFSMGGAAGLSGDQIQDAVRGFQRQTLRCSDGRSASGTVVLELTVGCDGRVIDVAVAQDGTGVDGFGECVARVMGYAPFPAHDMPDGVGFTLPLRYE